MPHRLQGGRDGGGAAAGGVNMVRRRGEFTPRRRPLLSLDEPSAATFRRYAVSTVVWPSGQMPRSVPGQGSSFSVIVQHWSQ